MDPANLWKPSNPEFISNPFPYYHRIREQAPVFKANTGDFVVMDYEGARQVLLDKSCKTGVRAAWVRKMSSYAESRNIAFPASERAISGMLIQLNPPEHTRIHSLLSSYWPSADVIREKAVQISREIADQLPPTFDVVEEVSKKLPVWMICDVLGVNREEGQSFMLDSFRLVRLLDPYLNIRDLEEAEGAGERLYSFLLDVYQSLDPEGETISGAIKRFCQEKENKDIDGVALLVFLFIAGFETTSALISMCLLQLINRKKLILSLRQEGVIENFVQEVLRLYSPVQLTGRTTTQSLVMSGLVIPAGSTITICLGSANRDPSHFELPDDLDLNRPKYDHLSFGYGIHRCLGSQMAFVEATEIIKAMLPKLEKMVLAGEPVFSQKLTVRSIVSMKMGIDG